MPSQEGTRGGNGGDILEPLQPELLGLGGQPSALRVVEPGPFAQLLLEDFDLFLEVFDVVLLVAVDPASQANHEKLKGVHVLGMEFWARQGQGFCSGARLLAGRNSRILQDGSSDASFRTVRVWRPGMALSNCPEKANYHLVLPQA